MTPVTNDSSVQSYGLFQDEQDKAKLLEDLSKAEKALKVALIAAILQASAPQHSGQSGNGSLKDLLTSLGHS